MQNITPGQQYYSDISLARSTLPLAVYMDIFDESKERYGKMNVPVFHRGVLWTYISPGKWTVEVTETV